MIKKSQIYKCEKGVTLEALADGGCADLTCCGEPMTLMEEKSGANEGKEKHVPVLKKSENGSRVEVGSVPHPMEEDHYIQWIEIINGDYVNRKYLAPGEAPAADFFVSEQSGLTVRAYCNKHGLWRA